MVLAALTRSSEGLVLAAFAALGAAVYVRNGHFDAGGVVFLGVAVAAFARLFALGLGARATTLQSALGDRKTWLTALLFTSLLAGAKPPGIYLRGDGWLVLHFALLLAALVALAILAASPSGRRARWALVALFAAGALVRLCVIFASPSPTIDVFAVLQGGADALLRGDNPYATTFPSPYAAGALLDAYMYPPLTLLGTGPGRWLFGDVRFALLAFDLLSTALIVRLGAEPRARSAPLAERFFDSGAPYALLFLVHPRGAFVLEQAWTEPIALAALLAYLLAVRARRVLVAGLLAGLALAAKQYVALLGPLLVFGLYAAAERRLARTAAAVGVALVALAATLVPFVVWDPVSFYADVARFHAESPFRPDALSFAAALHALTGYALPGAASLLAALAAAVLGVAFAARAPGSAARLATAAAGSLLFALPLQKHAFCNYYYLVGALCCAAAAAYAVPSSSSA